MRMLQKPEEKLVWVNATDPAQSWGNILPHLPGRGFTRVPGTAAACLGGRVAAVMERQGKLLRLFEPDTAKACMKAFAREYDRGKIFAGIKRIVLKEYPDEAREALEAAGFRREMQDYVLYRS